MAYKLTTRFSTVNLHHFSGEIESLDDASGSVHSQKEPLQHAGQIHPNNIIFTLRSKSGALNQYQFCNANFDFRIGHYISILTSKKSHFHRLVINHNTQRVWYPNPNSAAKEFRMEKIFVLSLVISACLLAGFSIYFFGTKYFEHAHNSFFTILGALVLFLLCATLIVLRVLRQYCSRNLHERLLKPKLSIFALKIFEEQAEKISKIR